MERRVLFIQGGSEGAHDADAKLAASLERGLGHGYRVHFPKMPNETEPDYTAWKDTIVRKLARMGDGAILVGHSIGGSVVARLICEGEASQGLAGVFLASSPFWHDDSFWRWDEVRLPKDAGDKFPAGVPLFLYHGRADEFVPFAHLKMYAAMFPQATVRPLDGHNHQLNDDLSAVARDIKTLA
jgi:predicted alpha/beta hydrolase family esterase